MSTEWMWSADWIGLSDLFRAGERVIGWIVDLGMTSDFVCDELWTGTARDCQLEVFVNFRVAHSMTESSCECAKIVIISPDFNRIHLLRCVPGRFVQCVCWLIIFNHSFLDVILSIAMDQNPSRLLYCVDPDESNFEFWILSFSWMKSTESLREFVRTLSNFEFLSFRQFEDVCFLYSYRNCLRVVNKLVVSTKCGN